MKKVIVSVLLAVMLLCSTAFAYDRVTMTSGDMMPYEYPEKFAMDYPSDCVVVNYDLGSALSAGLVDMSDDDFFANFGVDKAYATSLLEIAPLETLMSSDVIVGPDMISNIIVNVTPVGLTYDMIGEIGDTFGQSLLDTYASSGFAAEDCAYLGVLTCGSYDYVVTSVNFMGYTMYQYITFNAAGDMIMLNITAFDEAVIAEMLETVVIY